MIDGVVITELKTHRDSRGFFREILREDTWEGDVKQLSHSRSKEGTKKINHWHKKQIDWWYVYTGALQVFLIDMRDGSPTEGNSMNLVMRGSESPILRIPAGVVHSSESLTETDVLYFASQVYDPEDDLRYPPDDGIAY